MARLTRREAAERQRERGMRREGRATGYARGHESHDSGFAKRQQFEHYLQDLGFSGPFQLVDCGPPRRIKISNKPTNQSKDSSRCKRSGCRNCHFAPASKALSKCKGIRNKLYTRKFHGAHRSSLEPHLLLDHSFFDLHDYDPLSDPCDASYDSEEDTTVDAYGFHRDVPEVQPDRNAHEHELGWDNDHGCFVGGLIVADGLLNASDDHSIHRLDTREDFDPQECLSSVLVTHNGISDAVYSAQMRPNHSRIADLVTVNNAHLPHPEALQQCEKAPDQDGFVAVSQSFPPIDEDGSIEWCLLKSSEVESDEDDWIMC